MASAYSAEENQPRRWRRPQRLPLRVSVVLIVVAIMGVGMIASATAVNSIMRNFAYNEVDGQLVGAASGWARNSELYSSQSTQPRPPSSFYVEQIFSDGTSVRYNDSNSSPDLSMVRIGEGPFTVGASPGSADESKWRVVAISDNRSITVVARSVADEERLLRNLRTAQWGIGLMVLLAAAGIAAVVVHRSLQPLRNVADTAEAITGGDLDRRVQYTSHSTEVGKVGAAMNTMLEQLQSSLTAAQDKEEQMRRFVGDASHELRTPLTSVRGYAELYQSGAMNDPDRVVAKVREEADRMSELVEGLLALARAEGMTLNLQDTDVVELCQRVVGDYRDADITVEAPSPARATVDADKIRQVLVNLLNNARAHGAEPITVRVQSTPEQVEISVADCGPGMNEHDAQHVFERFYRADTSRSRASGGSGLGLAIVSSLVDAHQGQISLDTAEGRGAVFSVRLPRTPDPDA
ncbi:cell wall metabolism sensor histidine kinase WalK [Corynebacterium sp. TAE3-ERU30]|uniref:sensor histidine kinase n=1 Tax=Corynebacterium sp. TAE3-ERU30 TaxID=2849496 RepID=UPI001C454E6A|nr:HAMP domain-containing sensor histidine kinase [Corynebacterium sp. TAE3-ERU30]MBV7281931.1 HAMP domain-containing histidine kinase [Corynebacterium sp. TAE3-ERU30]